MVLVLRKLLLLLLFGSKSKTKLIWTPMVKIDREIRMRRFMLRYIVSAMQWEGHSPWRLGRNNFHDGSGMDSGMHLVINIGYTDWHIKISSWLILYQICGYKGTNVVVVSCVTHDSVPVPRPTGLSPFQLLFLVVHSRCHSGWHLIDGFQGVPKEDFEGDF